ncbi:hypothetical protein N656DRAFT_514387 [Canariomyces notabilis]|uniref:Uncharacterized protein n=1 Tax=Canariomyces notabilis TaxID=2074819 RepID=A0AAN6T784_9PEZI|nr:hypothetical protein N656DRAFT_514387 [Canariomyces arenarius]
MRSCFSTCLLDSIGRAQNLTSSSRLHPLRKTNLNLTDDTSHTTWQYSTELINPVVELRVSLRLKKDGQSHVLQPLPTPRFLIEVTAGYGSTETAAWKWMPSYPASHEMRFKPPSQPHT